MDSNCLSFSINSDSEQRNLEEHIQSFGESEHYLKVIIVSWQIYLKVLSSSAHRFQSTPRNHKYCCYLWELHLCAPSTACNTLTIAHWWCHHGTSRSACNTLTLAASTSLQYLFNQWWFSESLCICGGFITLKIAPLVHHTTPHGASHHTPWCTEGRGWQIAAFWTLRSK